MFEHPSLLWLLIALPLMVAPGWVAIRAPRHFPGILSMVLRGGCFAALVLALAGLKFPVHQSARHLDLIVALDESRSIAADQQNWMKERVAQLRHAMGPADRLAVIGFGRDAQTLSPLGDPRLAAVTQTQLDAGGTDIAAALLAASGFAPQGDQTRILLLSDGIETQGDALAEAQSLHNTGIEIFTCSPPPSTQARAAITALTAPSVVRTNLSFALQLTLESEAASPAPALLKLFLDGREVGRQPITLAPGMTQLQLPYRVSHPGAYSIRATLSAAPPLTIINGSAETPVSVAPPPRVLVIATNPAESLVNALKLRGYEVDGTAPRGLPVRAENYLPYQTIIIVNTPASALSDYVQDALSHYVADFGGGLIMAGDSLRDSAFHGSPLEKTLPITFLPQPPPPSREPIAVYLLIDRSNSMSYNSRYPAVRDYERIRYAKQAATALLNQLDDTDYAGVIAFDSEPYVLGHLRPLGEDRRELLSSVQRLEPGGGTDFKESLGIAEREILGSGIAVREVILLTDGDTNRQYHDHDQLMADFAKQGIPVSTIRIGPDLENLNLLQDFAHITGGVFYRVEDITKLPQLLVHLTHEAQNFKLHERARVDFGAPSSILTGLDSQPIPPIDYFAISAAKDGSEVPLLVRKGPVSAPLLATWQFQLGRTAIFAGDPDSMGSLAWIRWNHYAEFWSQLVSWVARQGDPGLFTLNVASSSQGTLRIEAEKADQVPVTNLFCRISGPHQITDIALSQTGASTYRGESLPLTHGKYQLTLMLKAGDTERVLLRREIAAPGFESSDNAELRLKPPNRTLLQQLAQATGGKYDAPISQTVAHNDARVIVWRPIESILIPLAAMFLLMDVIVRRRLLDT
jgi:Mg-chelatase subunit ChlD